jgi:hypothetical protein
MQWFSRGKLWESPEAAREALIRERTAERPRERGRDWRPGGEHKDPRDRFKVPRDVKRARFKAKLQRDRVNPKPGAPPVPTDRQRREGGERQRREGGERQRSQGGQRRQGRPKKEDEE